ncbi:ComEC family competence protein [Patescibacteria group bacterium]|nr:ComEC family competence protein [Patescibacteria group bacterium]
MKFFTPSTIMRTLCIAFLAGIAFASWGFAFFVIVSVLGLMFIIGGRQRKRFQVYIILACLVVAGVSFGLWRYTESYPSSKSIALMAGQEVAIKGLVVEVDANESWQHVTLTDLSFGNQQLEDRLLLTTMLYPQFSYGDQIQVKCTIEAPKPIEDFAYDRYLQAKDVWATCFSYQVWKQSEGGGSALIATLLNARINFIEKSDQVFGEPHASLLAGLLLGEQRFTDVWKDRFLKTGTTHIVAASGYNISVVLWIAMGFFASIGVKRQKAFAFLVASIAGYILLAGADAAVFRAGVMGIVLLLAHQTERKTSMVNILLVTAVLMLAINPRLLRDDVGFQLSMASTIGLIYLSPILKNKFKWLPKKLLIQESIIATLSATFASLPILILQFGTFSFASLLTNIFVLPWIPLAMAGGSIATLIGFVSIEFGAIISAPAWLALTSMLWAVKVFASLNLYLESIPLAITIIALLGWGIVLFLFIYNRYSYAPNQTLL